MQSWWILISIMLIDKRKPHPKARGDEREPDIAVARLNATHRRPASGMDIPLRLPVAGDCRHCSEGASLTCVAPLLRFAHGSGCPCHPDHVDQTASDAFAS